MPHRVATFFRQHSSHFNDLPKSKDSAKNSRSPSATRTSRNSIDLTEGDMAEHHKRLSLSSLSLSSKTHKNVPLHQPATLDVVFESPPLLFLGPATSSTGALMSGQFQVDVKEQSLTLESLEIKLTCEVSRKKPFHAHCADCSHQSTELMTWNFLDGPVILPKGLHQYPFSYLFKGHLPATSHGPVATIDYILKGTLKPKPAEGSKPVNPIKYIKPLDVKRAIPPNDLPRHSIRIFPPTTLVSNVELPSVIHPIGEFKCEVRMDGVVGRNGDTQTQTQWRLKRINWKIEETQKTISPACAKHSAKLGADAKKGIEHIDVRTIAHDEMKTGWKSNYMDADGCIELEFPFAIRPEARPVCDMKSEDGTEVSHSLIVEMIISEEFAPLGKPKNTTATGSARVLRMHFGVTVTERRGLGISWDEEQPPLYENVPDSPPGYTTTTNDAYYGPPLPDYEELDNMNH